MFTSDLAQRRESISSINITLGYFIEARINSVFTSCSASPTHLLVKELADILKKVALAWLAIALPIIVLPVPGGPNNSKPYNELFYILFQAM